MGVEYTPQDLIPALDTNWAEKGRENTRRANAFAAAAKAAIEALQAAVSIKKVKLGSSTYTPDADGLVTLPAGVVAPTMTSAERDAITNPTVGQLIENTTTGLTERYTSSGWRPVGSYGQPMTTTQRDAIANPPNGLVIDNTTLGRSQIRRAGAWADLTPSAVQKAQGSYTGDGADPRTISVGFTPDLVLLGSVHGSANRYQFSTIHSTGLTNGMDGQSPYPIGRLTTGGFLVGGFLGNNNSNPYSWTAFKFV